MKQVTAINNCEALKMFLDSIEELKQSGSPVLPHHLSLVTKHCTGFYLGATKWEPHFWSKFNSGADAFKDAIAKVYNRPILDESEEPNGLSFLFIELKESCGFIPWINPPEYREGMRESYLTEKFFRVRYPFTTPMALVTFPYKLTSLSNNYRAVCSFTIVLQNTADGNKKLLVVIPGRLRRNQNEIVPEGMESFDLFTRTLPDDFVFQLNYNEAFPKETTSNERNEK